MLYVTYISIKRKKTKVWLNRYVFCLPSAMPPPPHQPSDIRQEGYMDVGSGVDRAKRQKKQIRGHTPSKGQIQEQTEVF